MRIQTAPDYRRGLIAARRGAYVAATGLAMLAVAGPVATAAAAPTQPACTREIVGTVGSLTVTSGVTCLDYAHVTGGITLGPGTFLELENSFVSGSITGYGTIGMRICGSTTGSIAVSRSTGQVIIGLPFEGCAANDVLGSVTATRNVDLAIVGNEVSGAVLASGNTGAVLIGGNHP